MTGFDEEIHSLNGAATNPETLLLHRTNQLLLRQAMEELPVEYREVVILRELEGLILQGNCSDRRPTCGDGHVALGTGPQAAAASPGQSSTHGGLR